MTEIPFLSVDPENETSGQDDSDTPEEMKKVDVHVPKIKEIEKHINSFKEKIEPGTEVLEICGDTVNPHRKVNAEDFQVLKVIGKGGYGTVFLVQKITKSSDQDKFYAMKVLKKAKLIRNEKNTVHTVSERNILQMLKHPFLVRLHYAFQNRSNLYIVLEYCPGGELFRYLERECYLMEDAACFYISEIALAIGHLHSLGIIYRDLKPENILLDKDGHVKLTDFGLSKEGVGTTNTFCGTIEYMAPEIIRCAGHGRAVDWWSLGTLLFDMLSGGPPFSQEGDKKATAEKILKSQVRFPPSFSTEAIHLIRGLLKKDPKERLGNKNDVEDIKEQLFFVRRGIDWDDVYNRKMEPPYKPELSSDSDVSMFDPSFTGMKPIVSPGNSDDPVPADLFQGFSFVASSVMEPPRAIVPDFSRIRNSAQRKPSRQGGVHEKSESSGVSPSASSHGVDLRDFATNSQGSARPQVAASTLESVCERGEDEDNIPGAKAIRFNGWGGVEEGNRHASNNHQPHKSTHHDASKASGSNANSKHNGGPRKLGDSKPCSYPNLLITRSGDHAASSTVAKTNADQRASPGAQSTNTLVGAASTPSGASDTASVTSFNSTNSASSRPKRNHHRHHRHHHHHQNANGGGGNGPDKADDKDSKCSIM